MANKRVLVGSDYTVGDLAGPYRTANSDDILTVDNGIIITGSLVVSKGISGFDTAKPILVYVSASGLEVQPFGVSTVKLTLQDGKQRTFTNNLSWSFGNGANDLGLDTGIESGSAWYYMYIVPKSTNDDLLTVRASLSPLPTGPTGYTNYKYIGPLRNDNSSNLINLIHVDSKLTYNFMENGWFVSSAGVSECTSSATVSAKDLSAFVPVGTTNFDLWGYMDCISELPPNGPQWTVQLYYDGVNYTTQMLHGFAAAAGWPNPFVYIINNIPLPPSRILYKRVSRAGSGLNNLSYIIFGVLDFTDSNLL